MKRLVKNEVVSGVLEFLKDTNDASIAREVASELCSDGEIIGVPSVALVTSAACLPEDERLKIEKKMKSEFGNKLDISYVEDKSLIGGFIIRVGDFVYDNSISGQLDNIKQTLYGTI